MKQNSWHVIVIGGGHAGCEAASAASRCGAKTLLITQKISTIGEMSCNPAMGGVGKGHIIREIDACDGLMGIISDKSAIQYRLLNKSRGPAVQGPRAQIDRDVYKLEMQKYFLDSKSSFRIKGSVVEDSVTKIDIKNGIVKGVIGAKGQVYLSKAVVITTGTFLNGCIYLGNKKYLAGRIGEENTDTLAKQISSWGCEVARLKTGTPPRLLRKSIDWKSLEPQVSDLNPVYLSNITTKMHLQKMDCCITETNARTHDIIRKNQKLSPVSSDISSNKNIGTSVRYCPSIDDKIIRFANKDSHKIYLEPEGLSSPIVYPNGISTALPEEVQIEFIRSIKGCEKAEISQYGYAIAYDFINPQQLNRHLRLVAFEGLYCAGQINGTTGYEEAAGQGLIAGVNSARMALNKEEVCFDRTESYIGVMIDDLITFGVTEPYRVFTSRAEYRLNLRYDKSDHRLTSKARNWGLISEDSWQRFNTRLEQHKHWTKYFKTTRVTSDNNYLVSGNTANKKFKFNDLTIYQAFKRPNFDWQKAVKVIQEVEENLTFKTASICRADAIYEGYAKRQQKDIEQFKTDENLIIPESIVFEKISGLSGEAMEKLKRHRPPNLGAASRLEGVTFGAVIALMRYLKDISV